MNEEMELLKEAVLEIKTLRNENQLMNARLDMFDTIMAVLATKVAHKEQGMSPDLVFQIEKFINSKTN